MADMVQYLTFGAAKELFAVPVEQVREILELRAIARLPHAPDYLLGMMDVRGRGVPIVDLRLKLGFEPVPDTENTRIIVLDVAFDGREVTLGLKTDRVFEVTVLDGETLEQPPEIGVKWRSECIAGMGRRNGAFVTVLEPRCLFETKDVALLASSVREEAAA